MLTTLRSVFSILAIFILVQTQSQIVINEGSNKNYSTIADEDGDFPDWIELYNSGNSPVDLFDYSLTDDSADPLKWILPHYILNPGEFKVIFCSSKDRYPFPAATLVENSGTFVPTTGWNTHDFSTPYIWDGVSNVTVNTCSYSSAGYISNSVFNQTLMPFTSTVSAWADGSAAACGYSNGEPSSLRPNMKLNGFELGDGTQQNCNTCYPAPYGNWYWGARTQMLIRADELTAAGLTAGPITSLAFDVAYTDNVTYDYIEIKMNSSSANEMSNVFQNENGFGMHTNFSVSGSGESVFLYSPDESLASSITLGANTYDISNGRYPDASELVVLFQPATPGYSNDGAEPASGYADMPVFSLNSGFYTTLLSITIDNPNGVNSEVYYTLDGSDPTEASTLYTGQEIVIFQSTVLRARAFEPNQIPSEIRVATYFFNVSHVTPILSVTTDNNNLYGPNGNFDNPFNNWDKSAFMEYFDSIPSHPLLFSQQCAMIQEGGWGGSRTQPQRSFRLKMTDGVLGGGPMNYDVMPYRSHRHTYSDFYLRNGSNQYLTLPYKDACQVQMMAGETNNYYAAWRPISAYINGQYYGLFELREKFNKEKFRIDDNATDSTIELLSLSAFYGFVLRAIEGDVNHFYDDYDAYAQINPADEDYWEQADQYFDLTYYTDYIIGETWMGNVDWPGNNIKIYRSDATNYRWRYCLIDLELSLLPNSWTDCNTDHIAYMLGQGTGNIFLNVWAIGMNNQRYRNYFINRFADLMNTSYESSHLIDIENNFFNQTVVEMANEYQRWGDPWNVPGQMLNFYNNHLTFQSELVCRSAQVRNHLQNNFNLDAQVNVTLNVSPEGSGRIQINTVTPGNMPWSGVYFKGVPVNITAIPNPGFVFNHWLSDNIILSPNNSASIELNVTEDDEFTAYFIGSPEETTITISEINYNSDDTQFSGDWIELHNYGNTGINLTGWSLTNENNLPRYHLPAGTVLYPDQYLVLVRDTAQFHSQYPDVTNYLGPIPFNLNGDGGGVKLYDYLQTEFLSTTYYDSIPWPSIADGGGRTLELSNPEGDLNDPTNWYAGCMFGSPGEAFHPCPENIVFSEINYQSSPASDAGDWVEIRNIGTETKDISGWTFRDEVTNNIFQIPAQTILDAGEMVVLSSDVGLFDQQYPDVTNRVGGYDFGLKDNGDMIRLYDDQNKLYFSMIYESEAPWPLSPAGQGYTLELLDSTGNFNSSDNWFEGCLLGSPGVYYTICEIVDAVEDNPGNTDFNIYPNPTSGTAYLNFASALTSNAQLQIYDAMGRMVESSTIEKTRMGCTIQMERLSAGWYEIRITDSNKVLRGKVLRS